jgi:hypothetical protein
VDSGIRALATEHAELDLDHVELACLRVLWNSRRRRIRQASRECLIEGAGGVGRQVVPDEPVASGFRSNGRR